MNRSKSLKYLAAASLFIALDIVFTRFFSLTLFLVERFSLQFLATSLCAALLGPWWGMVAAATADVLGMLINSAGASFFPGFTLSAALRGLVYGFVLYNQPVSYKRVLFAEVGVSFGINVMLNSLWLSMLYGKGYLGLLALKVPVRLVWVPLASYLTFICLRALRRNQILQ